MKIKMYLYQKETKYTQVEPDAVLVYNNVRELTVKKIPKETILETSDEEMVDEFDEYLFIIFFVYCFSIEEMASNAFPDNAKDSI